MARGTLVTAGYHNLPEATAAIRGHDWHHTGDVGYIDEDGYVYIVDRKKDMIISGGFNVYCAEVEAGIMALPQVQECAVIGVPDEKWGEAVKAFVVIREGESLTRRRVDRALQGEAGRNEVSEVGGVCGGDSEDSGGKV